MPLNGTGADLVHFSDLDGFRRNTFSRELDDVLWLLDQITSGSLTGAVPERTGILGHSRGGGISILAAAECDRVDALVTWAAVADFERWSAEQRREWEASGVLYVPNARTGQDMPLGIGLLEDFLANRSRLDILAAARRVATPWLIVHGGRDESVPVDEAHRLHEEGTAAELGLLPETGHTFGATHPMESPPAFLEEAIDRSIAHFTRHLHGESDRAT